MQKLFELIICWDVYIVMGKASQKDTLKAIEELFKEASSLGHIGASYAVAVLYDFTAEEKYRDMEKSHCILPKSC